MNVLHNVRNSLKQDGTLLLQKHRIEDGWRKIQNEWLIIEDERVKNRWRFTHWVYSTAELEDMLQTAGFSVQNVYGSINGIPYDSEAERLVIVAAAE